MDLPAAFVAMNDDAEMLQFKQQCLDLLDDVLREIEGFGDDTYILDDQHLATLNLRRADPLDIEDATIDFGRRFFAPRFSLQQARQETTEFLTDHSGWFDGDGWPKRCRRGSFVGWYEESEGPYDPEERHPLCTPEACAAYRLDWFLSALGANGHNPWIDSCHLGVWEGSGWYYLNEVNLVPGHMLNLPAHAPSGVRVGNPPRLYSFHVSKALLLADSFADKPHIGAAVVDAAEPGEGQVLRSEVAAAVGLLKHQFRRGDFRQHHTLPAIVFSFHHDRSARITQFHFNGQSLTMRQSRLLDLGSDEPTTDAYHIIRWMANRPIGDTQNGAGPAEEQQLRFRNNHEANSGKLSVEVRGT